MTQSRLWGIGGAFAFLLLLIGGYFLGVAPQLAATTAADVERQGVETQNAALESQLAELEGKYATLDEAKTALASLRVSVPGAAGLSAMYNELYATASQTQVTVTDVTVADAVPYAPPEEPASTTVTASPAPDAAVADADAPLAVAAPDPALVPADKFVAIPVSVTIVGESARALDFVAGVQGGSRLFLVNQFSSEQSAPATPSDGEEVAAGPSTVKATLSGFVYVLLD